MQEFELSVIAKQINEKFNGLAIRNFARRGEDFFTIHFEGGEAIGIAFDRRCPTVVYGKLNDLKTLRPAQRRKTADKLAILIEGKKIESVYALEHNSLLFRIKTSEEFGRKDFLIISLDRNSPFIAFAQINPHSNEQLPQSQLEIEHFSSFESASARLEKILDNLTKDSISAKREKHQDYSDTANSRQANLFNTLEDEIVSDGRQGSQKHSAPYAAQEINRNYIQRLSKLWVEDIYLSARKTLEKKLKKLERLEQNLKEDLEKAGDAKRLKELADNLLAAGSFARSLPDGFLVPDLYDENQKLIKINTDGKVSVSAAAAKLYKQAQKSERAQSVIAGRITETAEQKSALVAALENLEKAYFEGDINLIKAYTEAQEPSPKPGRGEKTKGSETGIAYRFTSSDGFQILVGRNAKLNDQLTLRIARPHDIWLHTSDYPGSHVIIRAAKNQPVPQRTLLEAARLAMHYSKAREHDRAIVRWTYRKFVSKPKAAPAGMVRLTNAKTINVSADLPLLTVK
jgi:predicted ribosome quality control (RQC) complex YloA/Tae2 family protein